MNFHIHDTVIHTGILNYKSKYTKCMLHIAELILHSSHQFLFTTTHLHLSEFLFKTMRQLEKKVCDI